MAIDDAVSPDPVPTSRRAVLRSGVKLAYAAPVVAASLTLSAETADARVISGPTPTPAFTPTPDLCGGLCLPTENCVDGTCR